MVNKQPVKSTRTLILLEKMQGRSYTSSNLNIYVREYYQELDEKFKRLIFYHLERVRNGFRRKTYKTQLKEISLIRPAIDKIAGLDNPDHPHIGIARELAEQTFYELQKIYSPALNRPSYFIN